MSRPSSALRTAVADAGALLLPVRCSGCGAADRAVCETCERALTATPVVRALPSGLRVFAAGPFDGTTASIIRSFKDDGRTDAGRVLGAALRAPLAAALELAHAATALLVPVPSSATATARRGYRPLHRLLRHAGVRCDPVLRATRRMRDQAGLGASDRRVNLAHALAARRPLDAVSCVLVDDVVTSGATLEEARRALVEAGAVVVAAAVLAATPRRTDGPARLASGAW